MKKWLVPFAFPFISIVAFLLIGVEHVYRIKKRLIEKVEPKLTVMNRRGA